MTGAWGWWHDFFELLGGLAALGVLCFSVWVATRERTDRVRAEADRDEARAAQHAAEMEELRRAREDQARRLVVTIRRRPGNSVRPYVGVEVTWHNYSDMPVTELLPRLDGVIQPGLGARVVPPGDGGGHEFPMMHEKGASVRVDVVFSDVMGRRWARGAGGELSEVTDGSADLRVVL